MIIVTQVIPTNFLIKFLFLYSCLLMSLLYPKNEKLKGRKLIEKMFSEGDSVTLFPLKLIFLETKKPNKIGVSVSKKNFKKAVDRNKIKRLLREAYRHNKYLLIDNNVTGYAFMILYISKDLPDYKAISRSVKLIITKFLNKLSGDLK